MEYTYKKKEITFSNNYAGDYGSDPLNPPVFVADVIAHKWFEPLGDWGVNCNISPAFQGNKDCWWVVAIETQPKGFRREYAVDFKVGSEMLLNLGAFKCMFESPIGKGVQNDMPMV